MNLPDSEQPPRFAELKMARLHPGLAKPVVTLPLIFAAVIGFVLIIIFLLGFEKSYSAFSNRYVIEQARQAHKENRFDEAATIMERFAIGHQLDEQQRTLLYDVYLARAEQRIGRSDYVGAMSDLDKISAQYSKFILVTGRKNELVELIKVQQAQALAQSFIAAKGRLKVERSKLHRNEKPAMSSPTNSVLVAPSAISVVPQSETPRGAIHSESPSVRSESTSGSESAAGHSEPVDFPPALSNPAPSRSELPAQKGLLKAKAAKITESDQVRYNELLAGYFSQEHKQTSGASEPPSLKEWIDIGRPKF